MMGVPPQSPPPSQAAPAAAAPPRRLWRALLPLLLLVVPLGIHIAARYAPVAWQYWLMFLAAVLAAAIVGWTAVRVYFWGRERWQRRLQRAFLHRQDPYYVAGAKIEARIKEVHRRLTTGGMGPYGLPWFLIMGDSPDTAEAMLKNSGLVLPPQMDHGLNNTRDQIDRWYLANQAVFIDTCASPPAHDDRQWDILVSRLADLRPQEALSGVILMVDVELLATEDKDARERRHQATLSRLRALQAALRLSFPVYMVVTGLNRVPGFYEFFDGVSDDERKGMLGWSSPLGPEQEFDQDAFGAGLEQVKGSLDRMMLRRLAGALHPATADRIYIFNEETGGLLDAARQEALGLFTPNLYLDPLPLRGLFFAAGLSEGPSVSFRGGGLLAGRVGGAEHMAGPDGGSGWFVRDLFGKKILAERGMVSRPRHALRRNALIKSLAAVLAAGALALGGIWVFNSVQEARSLVDTLQPALEAAQTTLEGRQVAERPLELCRMLLDSKKVVAGVAWWERLTHVGRYHDLEYKLGQTHRACFQDLFLRGYIRRVENSLRYWEGDGDFLTFAKALAEYMRWVRAQGPGLERLVIAPMVGFVGSQEGDAQEIIDQYQQMQKEGGLSDNLTDRQAPRLVGQVLDRIESYLNPSPSAAGNGAWQQQSQWWLDFAQGLREVGRRYRILLSLKPPTATAPYGQTRSSYDYMVDSLSDLLLSVERLGRLVDSGASRGASWLHVDKAMELLSQAARGWQTVSQRLDTLSGESLAYKRRLGVSLNQDLYLVQLLGGRSSYAWLGETLAQAEPQGAQIVTDPLYQVGGPILELLEDLGQYHAAIERWQNGYQNWEQHVASSPHIGQQAEMLRLEERYMDDALFKLERVRQRIKALVSQKAQAAPVAGGHSLAGLARKLIPAGKGSKNQERQTETVRAGLLHLYDWGTLDKAMPGWLTTMKRARLYQTSLYWQELVNKFVFAGNVTGLQSWRDLKAQPIFATGDPNSLISAISGFANQWAQNVPPEFLAFSDSGGKEPTPPELRQFLALNSALLQFNHRWLGPLRKAAQQFVGCVHDMDLNPAKAWSQIVDTAGAGASGQTSVSWGALNAFSAFRNSFEQSEGPVLENITGTLVDIQRNAIDSLQGAVRGDFARTWKDFLAKYQAEGFDRSFPFQARATRSVSRQELDAFFTDLDGLAASYALERPAGARAASGQATNPYASRVMASLRSGGRVAFIKKCQILAAFLAGTGAKRPLKVTVRLVPGEVGRYFHWVRLRFGRGGSYDLSVYGQDSVTVELSQVGGPLSFVGLDVAGNPQTQSTPITGDFSLLQLPYALGSSRDPRRRHWSVTGSLPSVAGPGTMIPFTLELEFNQPLPELPKWPTSR